MRFDSSSAMPNSLDELPLDKQMALQQFDPELHSLLAGTAPAALEIAALQETLSEAATTPQERYEAALEQEIQSLIDSAPWGSPGTYLEDGSYQEGIKPNFTNQQRLLALAPERALVMKAAAQPKVGDPNALTEEEAARVNSMAAAIRAGRQI